MTPRHVTVNRGDIVVLVGTLKGAFLLRASGARGAWEVGGPYLPGRSVYTVAHDGRGGRSRVWASASSMHWGAVLASTDDWGRTWDEPREATLRFPVDSGESLRQIWQIQPGRAGEPERLYCGVEPAALFESLDDGKTWAPIRGLLDHPHRARWTPGGGGLCLHTVLPDPTRTGRMWVAVSTGGVYRTDDGGHTWAAKNRGVRAEFLPERYPEFGQCVHKIVQHPARPETLFLQNHWGLYRSDDAGDSWQDVAHRVPSDFGFAMAIHPHDPDTVYVLPLESDMFRCPPEGKLRVYRTRNGARSWQPQTRGLPQRGVYDTVLRDAMATDTRDPAGIYFGTRAGRLFASKDAGASWRLVADGLPPIVCVRAVVVDGAGRRARVIGSARRGRRWPGAPSTSRRRSAVSRAAAAGSSCRSRRQRCPSGRPSTPSRRSAPASWTES